MIEFLKNILSEHLAEGPKPCTIIIKSEVHGKDLRSHVRMDGMKRDLLYSLVTAMARDEEVQDLFESATSLIKEHPKLFLRLREEHQKTIEKSARNN